MVVATKIIAAYEHRCQRCGRTWQTLNPKPTVCRWCKSYRWTDPKN